MSETLKIHVSKTICECMKNIYYKKLRNNCKSTFVKHSFNWWKVWVLLDSISSIIPFHKLQLWFLLLWNTWTSKISLLTMFLCTASVSTYSVGLSDMEVVRVLGRLVFQVSFTQKKNWHSLKLDFCTLAFFEIRQKYFAESAKKLQRIK